MPASKIYYNPKCGTCRKVLDAMKAKGLEPVTIEYLKNPPTAAELDEVLKLANLDPERVVRKKEELYGQLGLEGRKLSRAEWLKVLTENPVLIERPLVVVGSRAVLARPPERIQELL